MEEFGDWIYIIVIIIAGVASLINATRKKARQIAEQNRPREIITTTNDEDDFWGELVPQTEQKPVIKVEPKRQEKPAYVSLKDSRTPFLNIHQEGQPSIELNDTVTTDIVEDYEIITVDELPGNPDEWRKAFIYNEIFSRKN